MTVLGYWGVSESIVKGDTCNPSLLVDSTGSSSFKLLGNGVYVPMRV